MGGRRGEKGAAYRDGDGDEPDVGEDVEEEDDVAVEFGDGGLAVVWWGGRGGRLVGGR